MAKYIKNCEKNLTDYQLTVLNLIDNLEMRKSLMSTLAYMTIINDRKNNQYEEFQLSFLKKDPNKLKISFGELYELYKKNHKKLSLTTLKERVYKLIELGLLKISKSNHVNLYTFITSKPSLSNSALSGSSTSLPTSENVPEPIENTIVQETETTVYPVFVTKDLDSNAKHNEEYENYISAERKVTDWDVVCNKLTDLFKACRIKGSWIKERVIEKLYKYYTTVTAKYLDNYILRTIADAQKTYHANYDKYVKNNVPTPQSNYAQNCCKPRQEYDFNAIEETLLGQ